MSDARTALDEREAAAAAREAAAANAAAAADNRAAAAEAATAAVAAREAELQRLQGEVWSKVSVVDETNEPGRPHVSASPKHTGGLAIGVQHSSSPCQS